MQHISVPNALEKHTKISENRNEVSPQPHNKNLYNFIVKLLDIPYFTFSLFRLIGRVAVEILKFASKFERNL